MSSDVRGTREFDEDGFHEIQLSGKQLVFLCMATTVVSIVIFLCGVLVGRGVRPVEPVAEAATAQATTEAPAAEPQPSAAGAESHAPAASTPPPSGPPPANAAPARTAAKGNAPPPATPAKGAAQAGNEPEPVNDTPPADELSYHDELANRGKKGAAVKGDAATADAAKNAAAKADAAKADAAKTAAAKTPPPVAPAAAGAKTGGPIAIQVGALKTRADAEALARRLSGKGYAAYLVSPEAGGPAVFKVRVGNYTNADEANRVKRRLEQEEKLKPWIIR